MSIQATSLGGVNWGAQGTQRMHRKAPDMSKDDLVAMQEKMKADGKDTTNLDKIIANFDDLDSDKSGKVSIDEVKSGSEKFGIELPKGPPRGEGPPPGGWGPPPGLLQGSSEDSSTIATDETSDSATTQLKKLNALLEQLLKQFSKTDSKKDTEEQSFSSSINIAA